MLQKSQHGEVVALSSPLKLNTHVMEVDVQCWSCDTAADKAVISLLGFDLFSESQAQL